MRLNLALAFAAGLLVPALSAQTAAPPPAPVATPQACLPSATLDELVKAIDDAVSGPAGKDRACLRQILLPDARLSPIARAADGGFTPHVLTADAWIETVRKRGNTVFYERQVKVSSEVYGHIAHLWSTYEIRPTPDGKPSVRGINSIQAVFDGVRWRVFEILWQAETPADPIPARYLP